MLITVAEAKTYLGIDPTDTSFDTFLDLQIKIVSGAVEEYCNRKFAETDYTQLFYREDFKNSSLKELELYHYPLVSITSVLEKDAEADAGNPVIDYRYHAPTAKLTKSFGNFFCQRIIEVKYKSGFAANAIPALIQSVVYGLVEERYNKKKAGVDLNFGSDVQRISIPGTISIDYDYSLQSNERKSALGQILGNYLNVLDPFRSERAVVGSGVLSYVS